MEEGIAGYIYNKEMLYKSFLMLDRQPFELDFILKKRLETAHVLTVYLNAFVPSFWCPFETEMDIRSMNVNKIWLLLLYQE